MTKIEQEKVSHSEQYKNTYYKPENGASITEILAVIIKRKILIISIISFSIFTSIFYAKSITPIYTTSIGLMEPHETSLSILEKELTEHIPRETIYDNGGEIVADKHSPFVMYLSKITSYNFKKKVFENGNFFKKFYSGHDPKELNNLILAIHNSTTISKKKRDEDLPIFDMPIHISIEGSNPALISEFLNSLATSAKKDVIAEIKEIIGGVIIRQKNTLQTEIENLRIGQKIDKSQKITNFSNALKIAKNLGLKNNNFGKLTNNIFHLGENITDPAKKDIIFPIWFLYGSKALEQELFNLKHKSAIELSQLNYLKEVSLKYYRSIDLEKLNIKVASLVQPALIPSSPIRPNKKLIVLIGGAVGLFIGILIAFIRESTKQLDLQQVPENSRDLEHQK